MKPGSQPASLRLIELDTLQAGSALRGDLHNHRGQVVMRAGHVLSRADLDTLRRLTPLGLFVGPDWDDSPTEQLDLPPEILAAVRCQRKILGSKRIRNKKRHAWATDLTLEIEETTDAGTRRREIRVVTCDLSPSGFAFSTNRFLHAGTLVRACFEDLPNKPCVTGVVRNCVHVSGTTHRIGVQFTRATRGGADGRESPRRPGAL